MWNKPRFVIDTNVLLSAALRARSVPRQAVTLAFSRGVLTFSLNTIAEVHDVFSRPSFDKYAMPEEREAFFQYLLEQSFLFEVHTTITACRDPKDNKFLELAVSAGAEAIITGDDDLLVLHPFQGVNIITPAAFLAQYPAPETPAE